MAAPRGHTSFLVAEQIGEGQCGAMTCGDAAISSGCCGYARVARPSANVLASPVDRDSAPIRPVRGADGLTDLLRLCRRIDLQNSQRRLKSRLLLDKLTQYGGSELPVTYQVRASETHGVRSILLHDSESDELSQCARPTLCKKCSAGSPAASSRIARTAGPGACWGERSPYTNGRSHPKKTVLAVFVAFSRRCNQLSVETCKTRVLEPRHKGARIG